jgi:hypothetical protein
MTPGCAPHTCKVSVNCTTPATNYNVSAVPKFDVTLASSRTSQASAGLTADGSLKVLYVTVAQGDGSNRPPTVWQSQIKGGMTPRRRLRVGMVTR